MPPFGSSDSFDDLCTWLVPFESGWNVPSVLIGSAYRGRSKGLRLESGSGGPLFHVSPF